MINQAAQGQSHAIKWVGCHVFLFHEVMNQRRCERFAKGSREGYSKENKKQIHNTEGNVFCILLLIVIEVRSYRPSLYQIFIFK